MTQPIRTRTVLHDWLHSRDRMKPHNPHAEARMTTIELLQGVVCVGLVLLLLWLVWNITQPNGIAAMEGIARYIKAVNG